MKWSNLGMLVLTLASGCAVAAPPEAPAPAESKSAPTAAPAAASSGRSEEDAARDERRVKATQRPQALLVSETQGLVRLLGASAKGAPDRAALLRRTGDAFVELAASAKKDGNASLERSAHGKAATAYETLLQDHPAAAESDAVTYYAGLEREALADLRSARTHYYEVIKKHPTSPYVPKAYYAFGVLFRQEGKTDLARKAFGEAARYPGSLQALAAREVGGSVGGGSIDDNADAYSTSTTTVTAPSGPKVTIESSLTDE